MNRFLSSLLFLMSSVSAPPVSAQIDRSIPTGEPSTNHYWSAFRVNASSASVIRVWTDVPNWPTWDKGLEAAQLDGPFQQGAQGSLRSDEGQKARFKITAYDPAVGYVMRSALPFGALEITRAIVRTEDGMVVIKHDVRLKGSAKLLLTKAAKRWRVILPSVVKAVAERAGATEIVPVVK